MNKVDVEMPGKEAEAGETPRLSPFGEEKPTKVKPERQYSRDELIELMTHPLSSVKHPCLESPQNKSLVSGRTGARWLEERWDNRKRTDSLTDEDRSDGSLDPQKKRINDPKAERLRKEQEVVLSPQRRSFNSGCFVNLPPQHVTPANRRPESPLKGEREPSHRELPPRRIGSGRIMRDPVWDFRGVDKDETPGQNINNHDFNFRQRDDRFERRTFERSHDKERERPQQRNSRYNNNERKKYEKNEPEEPEWFSGGPTSQHDTIELHGFDGPVDEKTPNKKQNKNNKSNSKNNRKVLDTINNKSEIPSARKSLSCKSSPDIMEQPRSSSSPVGEKVSVPSEIPIPVKETPQVQEPPRKSSRDPNSVFDFEDILNFDSLPPLLSMSNGCVDEGGSGSRFSQFFRRESPSPQQTQQDSRHSSTHDEMFNSMINDITSTNIAIPPDGDTYFAPISPAASSVKEESNKGPSASLLEMLQRGNQGFQGRKITKKPSLRDLEVCGKIHSVEELEARLRQEQGIGKPADYANRPSNKEEELAAFRKLMMSKQVQNMQDPKSSSHSGLSGGFQNQQQHGLSQQQQQMPIPHDLVMKLLHVQQQQRQQEVFAKLLAPPSRLPPTSQFSVPPPMPPLSPELQMHINNAQPSKELLQRPEAQTIIRSLKRGDITVLHLVEQLKRNTNMQPIHREILASIIKLHGLQTSVREPSPASLAPPSTTEQLLHQMLAGQQSQHQQQQLRIPSPHANVLQRVPSPRELVAHTQNILQNALLKKKLEEQKENFRKRQEMQRSHSPNVSVGGPGSLSPGNQQPNTTSPTPLAFTPTSVLRKMTADKDDLSSKPHLSLDTSQHPPKQESMAHGPQPSEVMRPKPFQQLPNTWNLLKPIQGRAIVKGNSNFSVPPPVVPSNVDYMSMPPQYKSVQRNKMPLTGTNPQQHFMIGVNRNNIQPPPSSRVRGMGGTNMLPQQQQQGMTQSVQQLLMNHNYNNPQQRNSTLLKPDCQPMMRGQPSMMAGRNYNICYQNHHEGSHDLSASPVSNQLARWFSPELLAQARAGKLPDMPPISPTQNMLSVEELERLQQAVHN